MKQGIHPDYKEITATCSCGNVIKINSTVGRDLNLTCVANAIRSTPASSVTLRPAAVLTCSTSASTWLKASNLLLVHGYVQEKGAIKAPFLCL